MTVASDTWNLYSRQEKLCVNRVVHSSPKTAKIVEAINKVLAEDDERPLTPKDLGLVKEEPEPEAKPEPPWRKSMYYGRKAG
jgi:hypothetical protein